MDLGRDDVIRLRTDRQGLHRRDDIPAVIGFGIQHAGVHAIAQSLAARSPRIPYDTTGLALAWTYRGAPHLHRREDLPTLATALVASTEDDARSKLSWSKPHVERTGVGAKDAIELAAHVAREVITEPMSKGAASAAMTRKVPEGLTYACRSCKSVHIYEQLMRLAMLPAGIELDPESPKIVLRPIGKWTPPSHHDAGPAIREYLRFLGPATPRHVADFLGSTPKQLEPSWPDDLLECTVDGETRYLTGQPQTQQDHEITRLLPPLDPYLQARDRDLIVPDSLARKQLWRILGNPGAVLHDGEIVASWRPKSAGRKFTVTVETFGELDPLAREAIEREAALLGTVRDATSTTVAFQ